MCITTRNQHTHRNMKDKEKEVEEHQIFLKTSFLPQIKVKAKVYRIIFSYSWKLVLISVRVP